MTNVIPGPGYGPQQGAAETHGTQATELAGRPTPFDSIVADHAQHLREVRNMTAEAAADTAEKIGDALGEPGTGRAIAAAIRMLKGKPCATANMEE